MMNILLNAPTLWLWTRRLLKTSSLYLALSFAAFLILPVRQEPLFWFGWACTSAFGLALLAATRTLREWAVSHPTLSIRNKTLLRYLAINVLLFIGSHPSNHLMNDEFRRIMSDYTGYQLHVHNTAYLACLMLFVCWIVSVGWTASQVFIARENVRQQA